MWEIHSMTEFVILSPIEVTGTEPLRHRFPSRLGQATGPRAELGGETGQEWCLEEPPSFRQPPHQLPSSGSHCRLVDSSSAGCRRRGNEVSLAGLCEPVLRPSEHVSTSHSHAVQETCDPCWIPETFESGSVSKAQPLSTETKD